MYSIPEEVEQILHTLSLAGFEVFVVGGAVRDMLLGRPVNDWDFTTNATPEEILAHFADSFYNNKFGTVGVPAQTPGFDTHEITTYRTEYGYTDSRRPDTVSWGKTLAEDLTRRDFTINALALKKSEKGYEIIDLFGGRKDLEQKLIRAVGDAHERFSEDALRLMRAIRIATELGFNIEQNTFEAIKTHASLINKISKERVRDELFKILAASGAYQGILMLRETGLLQHILPELEKTFGVEQKSPGRHHIYDVGTHCLMALKHAKTSNPIVKLAILIHDIGKPPTYKKLENGTITFYNHEVVGSKIAKVIAERLKLSKKDSEKLWRLVRWHQFTVNEHQTDSALRRFIRRVGIENVEDMLILRTADRLGGGAAETSWRLEEFKKRLVEVQRQPFTVRDLKITGHDVMKELELTPGPHVGHLLNSLFKEVEENKIPNEREALLSRLSSLSQASQQ